MPTARPKVNGIVFWIATRTSPPLMTMPFTSSAGSPALPAL
jgi:hypothetical protein